MRIRQHPRAYTHSFKRERRRFGIVPSRGPSSGNGSLAWMRTRFAVDLFAMKTVLTTLVFVLAPSLGIAQTSQELVRDFRASQYFWQQLEVAKKMVATHDPAVLKDIEPNLNADDRHLRGNAAFVFAGLGDNRGFTVIYAILKDRSPLRSEGDGVPAAPWTVAAQIKADRYYAVHLLGTLKSSQATSVLVQFLKDSDINYKVAWALGEIGDKSAVPPLLHSLDDKSPDMRVAAIDALVNLQATEALPKLRVLLRDNTRIHTDGLGPVSEFAKAAIVKLEKK